MPIAVAGTHLRRSSRPRPASVCPAPRTRPATAPPDSAARGLSTRPAAAVPARPAMGEARRPAVQAVQASQERAKDGRRFTCWVTVIQLLTLAVAGGRGAGTL